MAVRPRNDYSTTYITAVSLPVCELLHFAINKYKVNMTAVIAGYVTVTLTTFDNQSNGRRIEVKS